MWTLSGSFEGQGHRPEFTVTEGKVCQSESTAAAAACGWFAAERSAGRDIDRYLLPAPTLSSKCG